MPRDRCDGPESEGPDRAPAAPGAGAGLELAARMAGVASSAIRDLLAHAARPGMLSLAGGLAAADAFDVEGLRAAALEALADPQAVLQYGPTEGWPALRSQLATLMAARGAPVDAARIVVTTGSQQALDLVARALVDPGDRVIVERPTYLAALQVFALAQARIDTIGTDADGARVDELPGFGTVAPAGTLPRLLYLVPNFGNPSGTTLAASRRRALLQWAVRHRVPIIEDDPYGELWFDAPPPASLLAGAREVPGAEAFVVHVSSLSKIVSPSLRVGWVVAPPALGGALVRAKQAMDLHTSTLSQALAERYLASGRLAMRLPVLRAHYARRRDALVDALAARFGDRLAINAPGGGMFLWARFADGSDTRALLARALAHDVMFVPGEPFFAHSPDPAALRLSFSNVAPDACAEAVARLARAARAGELAGGATRAAPAAPSPCAGVAQAGFARAP